MKTPRDFTIPSNLSRHMVEISKNTTLEIYADVVTLAWLQNQLQELAATKEELAKMTQHLLDFEEEHYDIKRRQQSMQRYMKKHALGDERDGDWWEIQHADMLVWSGQRDYPDEPIATETELPSEHPWAVKE